MDSDTDKLKRNLTTALRCVGKMQLKETHTSGDEKKKNAAPFLLF